MFDAREAHLVLKAIGPIQANKELNGPTRLIVDYPLDSYKSCPNGNTQSWRNNRIRQRGGDYLFGAAYYCASSFEQT